METYCLLEKLKETIESDFRGKFLRFTSSLHMCTWTLLKLNLASCLMPTVSSSCTLIFFNFVERAYLKTYFKIFDNI